eukprot:scaffold221679_cov42-Prasinocladus_malaysianus.AAC.1
MQSYKAEPRCAGIGLQRQRRETACLTTCWMTLHDGAVLPPACYSPHHAWLSNLNGCDEEGP